MPEIIHTVQMNASPARVFGALTDRGELRGWWMRGLRADDELQHLVDFRLDSTISVKMRVAELTDGKRVVWHCVGGCPDWIGTEVTFELLAQGDEDDETLVRLEHRKWRETTGSIGISSAKWALFLFSLKAIIESPAPEDLD
jgi:uncharacterized protein YndB with AHSA1/START domain